MEVETIVYNKNSTSYLPPAYSLDYVSHPTVFMFVNPSDLGKPEVRDGLVYNGTVNGLYEYYQLNEINDVKILYTIWVEPNGIIKEFQTIQIAANGAIVGNATAVLWLTNIGNSLVGLPSFLSTYTEAKVVTVSNLNFLALAETEALKIMKYIIFTAAFLIVIILLFRK